MKLTLSRRDLLALAALAASSRALGADPAPPAGLSAEALRTLEAACARILPSDADGPGAREAQVIRFLERQAAGPLARLRPALEQGALLLDKWSQRRFARGFAQADEAQQDEVLNQLSRAQIPVKSFPQAALFRALHALTLEGFASDPAHGGNDGERGWRAIGFTAPGLRHVHHR